MEKNKLDYLQIDKFRKLKDISINVAERITVIAGHNGIGKSTILGLIANGSELKKYRSYFDKTFQSKFQEIFHLDSNNDYHSEQNEKYSFIMKYTYEGETLYKKGTISNHDGRLKVVPRNSNEVGKLTNESFLDVGANAKVTIPTIYIGMSRVIPIGETDEALYTLQSSNSPSEEDIRFMNEAYIEIIGNEPMENEKISKQSLKHTTKRSIGPSFVDYPFQTVSLGQDSLSSILTAILSFRKLKRELDEGDGINYNGGLLVIDEIDACLHPSAQEKLLNILDRAAKDLNLQIVVTSHSLTIIKEVLAKQLQTMQNPADEKTYYNVIYLQNTMDPHIMKDPTYLKIKNDMFLRFNRYQDHSQVVKVYFEDEEAYFLYKTLMRHLTIDRLTDINLEEVIAHINCDTLLKLPDKDSYFRNVLIMPDGDVKTGRYEPYIERHDNICPLPSDVAPEVLVYNYLKYLLEDMSHSFWKNNLDHLHGQIVRDRIIKDIEDKIQSRSDKKSREYFKEWFNEYKDLFEKTEIISYWMNDNPDEVTEFEFQMKISLDYLKEKILKEDG
ncbi:AAA family ATPase [Thalassobacillus sp. CUG 92003]|uniref:AAA family ATPase n=1 Tax=Thalassobacillus sp. CUG 92003 TaxID=2736641 RepID=UPI0015E689A1|nr:AAA family ATPase [Thalassobacillus sp. CUG 92003]